MPAVDDDTPGGDVGEDGILIGKSRREDGRGEAGPLLEQTLLLRRANRHGLVAGATGTGKTVTLQTLAEGFSNAGVPVFAADVKGDLSGVSQAGDSKKPFVDRAAEIGVPYAPDDYPVVFWDLFGERGHPIRATVSEIGPLLLSRLLDLNDTQEGILNIAFRLADEEGLLLLDLKDLRALLAFVAQNAKQLSALYGNVSRASVGAIQRQLLVLENQGGEAFLGEPALDIRDLMRTDRTGRGTINLLCAERLMATPRLYATFLLWLLSELFETLPEVGDPDKPVLVFFFDEAHLLFDDAPKALLDTIERVVRLVRSKGVGVYFVTQNPLDLPDEVLGQLGNRVQHALRAFTPRDQRAVRAAAETFRQNEAFAVATAITELRVGEALVSTLDAKGAPSVVERTLVAPPMARVGPATEAERDRIVRASPLAGRYDTPVDRESAYEILAARAEEALREQEIPEEKGNLLDALGGFFGVGGNAGGGRRGRLTTGQRVAREVTRTVVGRVAGQAAADIGRAIGGRTGSTVGRAIVRGVLGGMLRR
ncbi:helicase HerA-like domain-containing protein [Salinarimonas chemoclinalis]|uniref:helicase HerA-like domain-containing protein n=1 Tax=Salinarimonas chemoclinalis TaxID=3241599 RepID=UPI00355696CF